MRCPVTIAVLLALTAGATAYAAQTDDVSVQIDSARQAYAKGDSLHAFSALQAAANTLNFKLSEQFGRVMPAGPAGWEAAAPESESLDTVGGGLTVTRGYTNANAALNATLIVDNPAVGAAVTMFQSAPQVAAQPGWSRIRIGTDDAMLRFDPAVHTGEIMMVVSDRVLLQVEGTEITTSDPLVEAAKGWDVSAIRKLLVGG